MAQSNPEVLQEITTDLKTAYNKQYEVLKHAANNTKLEINALNFPKDFLGADKGSLDLLVNKDSLIDAKNLKTVFSATEKLYTKNASLHDGAMVKSCV